MDYRRIYVMMIFIIHCKTATLESRYVVGFYSACFNRSNRTKIHEEAALYYNMTKSRMHEPCLRTSVCIEEISIQYEGYDVCEDSQKLIELFLTLLLDKTNSSIGNTNTSDIIKVNRVKLITTFLTPWMQKLLFEIDYQTEIIPIAVFNEDTIKPSSTDSFLYIIMDNTIREDVSTISQMFSNLKWERVGILHLQNSLYPANVYSVLYHEFISSFPIYHPTLCFYRDNVDVLNKTDFQRAVKNLQQEYLPNVVVLFGLPTDQTHFLNFVNRGFYTKHIWVILDVNLVKIYLTTIKKKIISLRNRFRTEMANIQQAIGVKTSPNAALTKIEFIKIGLKKIVTSKKKILQNYIHNFNDVDMEGIIKNEYGNIFFRITSDSIFTNAFYEDYKDLIYHLDSAGCKKFLCSPGWYQTKGKLLQQETVWDVEYGWTCRKCLDNHIKPMYGNSSCVQCPTHTISNNLNTMCYDPYKPIFLKKNLTYVVCVTISIISIVLTIILVIVFLTYRNTPIGKSSNLAMTIFHLIINLSLHSALFYIQHTTPSLIYCIAKIFYSGIMYNLFVSVAFMKSHKLFKAFSSKRKATEKDKKITKMQQLFTIAILVASSVVLLIVSFAQDFPSVVRRRDIGNYLIYYLSLIHI